MARLSTRLARLEKRIVAAAARCAVCGGEGPGGLVYTIEPDEPKAPPPCTACGRASRAMLFRITLATPPAR